MQDIIYAKQREAEEWCVSVQFKGARGFILWNDPERDKACNFIMPNVAETREKLIEPCITLVS